MKHRFRALFALSLAGCQANELERQARALRDLETTSRQHGEAVAALQQQVHALRDLPREITQIQTTLQAESALTQQALSATRQGLDALAERDTAHAADATLHRELRATLRSYLAITLPVTEVWVASLDATPEHGTGLRRLAQVAHPTFRASGARQWRTLAAPSEDAPPAARVYAELALIEPSPPGTLASFELMIRRGSRDEDGRDLYEVRIDRVRNTGLTGSVHLLGEAVGTITLRPDRNSR